MTLTLEPQNLVKLTDGSERQLPAGARASEINATKEGNDLIIQATVNGLKSANQEAFGFAILRKHIEPAHADLQVFDPAVRVKNIQDFGFAIGKDIPFGLVQTQANAENAEAFFGIHFMASAKQKRNWRLVIETPESKAMSQRLGKTLTYQAEFTPEVVKSNVTLRLKDFKPVIRGFVQAGLPSLLEASQDLKKIKFESLSFQVTRDSIPDGRKSLDPINADLTIHDSRVEFCFEYGAR